MLVIRLLRTGKKNQPSFKIVVVEKTKSSTSGSFVEQVGFYNPLTKEKVLKQDRIKYWISVGAQPLATVHNLLVKEKVIEGKKVDVHNKAKVKEGEAPAEEKKEEAVSEAPVEEEKPAAKEPKQEIAGPEPIKVETVKKKEKPAETPKEKMIEPTVSEAVPDKKSAEPKS